MRQSKAALGERTEEFVLRVSFQWLLAQSSIHQFFDEFDTLELLKLCILADAAIEVQTDFPGPCEGRRIGDLGFVAHNAGSRRRVALDDFHIGRMMIPGPVEPSRIVLTRNRDHKRVTLPMSDGLSHPGVDGRGT